MIVIKIPDESGIRTKGWINGGEKEMFLAGAINGGT